MTFATVRLLARRTFGLVFFHLHEWEKGTETVGGVEFKVRFCGLAVCQRYEVQDRRTGRWQEVEHGGPWL